MAISHQHTSPSPAADAAPPARTATLWAVVVPVKLLAQAKSRLAAATGNHREHLALALAADTVTAALAGARVRTVVVVTDDPLARPALEEIGAHVVPDVPDSGLNPALRHGAAVATAAAPGVAVAAVSADLPALRPAELDRALDAAAAYEAAFVADAAGTGTTVYTAAPGHAFSPEFGPRSRDRHADSGAHELALDGIGSVRRDVDTAADLIQAIRIGVGSYTSRAVELLNRVQHQ